MALRFLANHSVSNFTVQTIREANHEVLRLRDVLPVESSDMVVMNAALRRQCPLLPDIPGITPASPTIRE
jgi:hypothetical protein